MNRIKKLCTALLISMSAALFITGCGSVIEKKEEEVLIPEYTAETLPDGIFVKSGDKFYQPYNGDKTYKNLPENTSADRALWYTDNKVHVPPYKTGDQIVYKNATKIPGQFVVEGFEHLCDSIGIRGIRLDDNGRYIITSNNNFQSTSDAALKIMPYLDKGTIILDSLNGNTITSRMINKTGAISGLTKGEPYLIGFYIGTQYYEETVNADTEIYTSKSINVITDYAMTKNGYLEIKMPDLLTPGLYDLNGTGVVNYSGVIQN